MDNSIKKDILVALISIVAFYAILVGANVADAKLGLVQVFSLVDIASVAMKVATASALAWVLKRVVFTKTLGKDFGEKFDKGWSSMTDVEKARWTIGAFLALFAVIAMVS